MLEATHPKHPNASKQIKATSPTSLAFLPANACFQSPSASAVQGCQSHISPCQLGDRRVEGFEENQTESTEHELGILCLEVMKV